MFPGRGERGRTGTKQEFGFRTFSQFRIFANFFSPFSIFVLRGQKKQQQNKKALVSDWRFGPGLEVEGQFGVCVPLFSASGFVALFRVVASSIGTLHIHTHTYKEHQKIDLGRYCPPLDSLLLLLLLFRLFSNQRDYPYIAYIFIDRKKEDEVFRKGSRRHVQTE